MNRILIVIVLSTLCFKNSALSQQNAFLSYQQDSIVINFIRMHLGFPEEAILKKESSFVLAKIFLNKTGNIDSVSTSNESIFSRQVKQAILLTNGKWSKRKRGYNIPIVIPFLFVFASDNLKNLIQINYFSELLNFSRWQKQDFIECLLYKPIIAIGDIPEYRNK